LIPPLRTAGDISCSPSTPAPRCRARPTPGASAWREASPPGRGGERGSPEPRGDGGAPDGDTIELRTPPCSRERSPAESAGKRSAGGPEDLKAALQARTAPLVDAIDAAAGSRLRRPASRIDPSQMKPSSASTTERLTFFPRGRFFNFPRH
jgi:hypothetical protein